MYKRQPGVLHLDAILIANVTLASRDDKTLRETAHTEILKDDRFVRLTETHLVVADVAVAKESGGLGASHPDETVILFRPG